MPLNRMFLTAAMLGAAAMLAAAPATSAGTQKWYEKAVKKVSAEVSPAEAKPGQTVTFSLTVELNEGYHTYPTKQIDKMADGMINSFKFPPAGQLIFVGDVQDPKDPLTKADPEIGITELRYYEGKVTFTRKAVVSPKAAPGPATVKLTAFKLSVCDKTNCFPPKDVPVEAAYAGSTAIAGPSSTLNAAEVEKALGGK
ncbi:MAG TPA: protein-disulfide reductase DsbD domain-containing protein [Gemmata sp.]|nr:protein-disulfide reductase DsbD domain-containing protein [Gemmata sp.]